MGLLPPIGSIPPICAHFQWKSVKLAVRGAREIVRESALTDSDRVMPDSD